MMSMSMSMSMLMLMLKALRHAFVYCLPDWKTLSRYPFLFSVETIYTSRGAWSAYRARPISLSGLVPMKCMRV